MRKSKITHIRTFFSECIKYLRFFFFFFFLFSAYTFRRVSLEALNGRKKCSIWLLHSLHIPFSFLSGKLPRSLAKQLFEKSDAYHRIPKFVGGGMNTQRGDYHTFYNYKAKDSLGRHIQGRKICNSKYINKSKSW